MFNFSDSNKIGIMLVIAGIVLYMMGLMFFFDRSLLLLGNILFLSGITTLVGVVGAMSFFTKRGKLRGSLFFFFGFFVLVMGFSILGSLF